MGFFQLISSFAISDDDVPKLIFIKKWGSSCLLTNNLLCENSVDSSEPYTIGDGQFWGIWGIASDNNFVYVLDVLNHRIEKFDHDGTFILKWGIHGTNPGEFDRPSGIAVFNDKVFVVDYNNRVQVFDTNGKLLNNWGSSGRDNGKFNHPEGITFDKNGHIYVADSGNHRIQAFTDNGEFVSTWGKEGVDDGSFKYPQAIAISNGYAFVADSHNNRIQKFLLNEQCPEETKTISEGICFVKSFPDSSQFGLLNRPSDLVADKDYLYVVDTDHHQIKIFDLDGNFVEDIGSECLIKKGIENLDGCADLDDEGPLEIGDGQFKHPSSIALASDIIFVGDNFNDRIQKFQIELPATSSILDPIANAGKDREIQEEELVTLSGKESEPDYRLLKFSWTQLTGPFVLFRSDTASPEVKFEAPIVSEDTELQFELEVEDDNGVKDTDEVTLTIISSNDTDDTEDNGDTDAGNDTDDTEDNGDTDAGNDTDDTEADDTEDNGDTDAGNDTDDTEDNGDTDAGNDTDDNVFLQTLNFQDKTILKPDSSNQKIIKLAVSSLGGN